MIMRGTCILLYISTDIYVLPVSMYIHPEEWVHWFWFWEHIVALWKAVQVQQQK